MFNLVIMTSKTLNKRREIINAALQVFAAVGYEKATIKQIAMEAGLSTPSLLYWYFKDKEEIFQAVLGEASPLISIAASPENLGSRPPEEVLPVIARTFLDSYDNPELVKLIRIILSEAAMKPEAGTFFARQGMIPVLDFLVDYLRNQVGLGKLRSHDSQSAARSFMGTLVIYLLSREIFIPLRENLPEKERYIQELVDIFLRGLSV
jgi:TetR/AcrR family transcriptional regulator